LSKAIPTNTAASVKQRLLNRARAKKEDLNLLLIKYALERVLYRIGQSQHRDIFVLKGALLFELWTPADCPISICETEAYRCRNSPAQTP
jgi:hypothetical protein